MPENVLDSPPEPRSGRCRRLTAIVAGVLIVAAAAVVIVRVGRHPAADRFARAGFGAGATPIQVPPAVPPMAAARQRADIEAAERMARSPALAARPVQIATVSPPAGPPPQGVGLAQSAATVGPAAG